MKLPGRFRHAALSMLPAAPVDKARARMLSRTRTMLSRPLAAIGAAAPSASRSGADETTWLLHAGQAPDTGITWRAPRGGRFEVHGHGLVLLDAAGRRRGEVLVDAAGPACFRASGPGPAARQATLFTAAEAVFRIRAGKLLTVDRGVGTGPSRWRSWDGGRRLTYLIEEPSSAAGRKRLCVVFSAIGAERDFTYNYRSALQGVDAYRVYILDDFGTHGSYYYADHRDVGIFASVQNLLRHLSARLDVPAADMTFVGSSKGGTAALAHGLRYGAGRIIAGAPQCFPGSYLRGAAPEILRFIAGDDSAASVAWLDRLLPDVLEAASTTPTISILVGENDSHRQIHVEPFLRLARKAGKDAHATVVQDLSHQNIGAAFGPFVDALLGGASTGTLVPYRFERRLDAPGEAQLRLWLPAGEEAALTLLGPEGPLGFIEPSAEGYHRMRIPTDEPVKVLIRRIAAGTDRTICEFETRVLKPVSAPNG